MKAPNRKIYGDFTQLVPLQVLDRTFLVPEGIPLIRAFQYIQFELDGMRCDWSLFCFNDTIGCCQMMLRQPGAEPAESIRACCQRVSKGLHVTELPQGSQLTDPAESEAG